VGKMPNFLYHNFLKEKKSPDYHKSKREDGGKVILKEIRGKFFLTRALIGHFLHVYAKGK
jgi:hypothetical protein